MLTQEMRHIAADVFAAIDTPVSLGCFLQLKYNEDTALLKRSISPSSYADSSAYLHDAAAISLLRKMETTVPGLKPSAAASQTWEEGERQCFRTNLHLSESFNEVAHHAQPLDPRLDPFVERARGQILRLMGSGPRSPRGRVGPGTTMSDEFGCTHVAQKFATLPTLADHSIGLLAVWNDLWSKSVQEEGREITLVRGNMYFQVPKTAATHRSCAKEPALNVYFQLGLGEQLKQSLRRRGIDLRYAKPLHRELARRGSIDESNATIDLSNASDTVSLHTVKLLIPPKWFNALDQCRSRRTQKDGKWRLLEKFSSMGNGFTFELETILFYGIVCSVHPDLIPGVNVHVFGDDIIVPSEFSRDVVAALRFWGFTPNADKTFTRGEFRESCGGDFWNGRNVRPVHFKKNPNAAETYITLHNKLAVLRSRITDPGIRRRLLDVCGRLRSSVPYSVSRCLGPPGLGDIVFHVEEAEWRFKWREGIRYIRSYVPLLRHGVAFSGFSPSVQIAAALYGISLYDDTHIGVAGGYQLDWTAWS